MRRALQIVPEPDPRTKRTVLEHYGSGTVVLQGQWGHIDLTCGFCGALLGESLEPEEIESRILRCNACSSWNDTESE